MIVYMNGFSVVLNALVYMFRYGDQKYVILTVKLKSAYTF